MIISQEQSMLRDSLREFCRERIAPFSADWDRRHAFPAGVLKELAAPGVMGMTVPEKWRGADMDYLSLALAIEEIAAADASTSTIVSVQNSLACGILMNYGNDAQKDRYLSRLASGEWPGCFCLTEPHAGSDVTQIYEGASDIQRMVISKALAAGQMQSKLCTQDRFML